MLELLVVISFLCFDGKQLTVDLQAANATERNVRKSSPYCNTDLWAIILFAFLD